ncbi:VOC family protein [Hydrogenophaga sp. PAMC20947]|uniref:VOC family protein n=1 Tax=Hydrogenophaga sp. PAMC20947 TaxID=2565558 RepID=UPI00109DB6D2|nr:VOC family protein [Hydrogenophaga sp. PAMC20947]QCB45810.1 VOC family protein [Hydrogenophaga sp. PAMC20947]
MQLAYTILYVTDVRRSVDFYERAFGLSPRFVHEGGDYGEMETGNTALAFSSRALMRQMGKQPQAARADAPCFEVAFTTADVPQALERAVSAGAALVQPAKQMPWGQTVAYVADLDGFLVEICTPVGGAL